MLQRMCSSREAGYLSGQLLVAMPGLKDENFARTVVYLCAHSATGAVGLVLNSPAPSIDLPELLTRLDVTGAQAQELQGSMVRGVRVCHGGPLETQRGFVLHSSDCRIENATLSIDDNISLTATVEILKVLADGKGPERAILALGYAGWGPGQLEGEIKANGWLHGPADVDTVFDSDLSEMYNRVIGGFGIEIGMLSSEVGHA